MHLKSEKYGRFLVVVLLITLLTGCEKRPEGLLSRNEMTNFLFELHKLDGTLMANGYGQAEDRENVYYYNALLEKHGITKAQFDSSVVWYTQHPKTFEKIYTEVMARLSTLEEDVKSGKYHPVDSAALRNSSKEMWPLNTTHNISPDSTNRQVSFDIVDSQLRWNDRYILKLRQRLWSDKDSTSNNRLIFSIHYTGGITDSVTTIVKSDSVLRRFTLMLRAKRQLPVEKISGELLVDSSKSERFFAKIDSISFIRYYDELAQDSIKTLIEKLQQESDSIRAAKDSTKAKPDTIKPSFEKNAPNTKIPKNPQRKPESIQKTDIKTDSRE